MNELVLVLCIRSTDKFIKFNAWEEQKLLIRIPGSSEWNSVYFVLLFFFLWTFNVNSKVNLINILCHSILMDLFFCPAIAQRIWKFQNSMCVCVCLEKKNTKLENCQITWNITIAFIFFFALSLIKFNEGKITRYRNPLLVADDDKSKKKKMKRKEIIRSKGVVPDDAML